jgi:PAS domain S-box-containing protein
MAFASSGETKSVLVLYSYNYSQPAQRLIAEGLEAARKKNFQNSDATLHEYLDISPEKSPEQKDHLKRLLLNKYEGRRFDLIITVFDGALRFLMDEGKGLSPESPCLALYAQERKELERGGKKVVQSPLYYDIQGTLELGLKLFPRTARIVFVTGTGKTDLAFEKKARLDFGSWERKLSFEYTGGRSVEALLKQVSHLAEGTLVIYGRVESDITGKTYNPREVAVDLARASSVPVFCLATSQLDTGVVGGSMVDVEGLSAMLGSALASLGRSAPLTIEPASQFVRPMINWDQISRWNVRESLIPCNALVKGRPKTLWSLYRGTVVTAVVLLAVLTGLTLSLSLENRRRKKAETEAWESEEKYRVLTESMKDVVWALDVDSMTFRYVSPSVLQLRGFTAEEVMAHTLDVVLKKEDRMILKNRILKRRDEFLTTGEKTGHFFTDELEQPCKDGSAIWVEVISRFCRNEKNGRVELRGVTRDISGRKKAESEREHLQEQLVQSRKMESVGRLAGGVAHDFNNMLNVIFGHSDIAMEDLDEKHPVYEDLLAIRKAAEHSADLTRQLLAFARKQTVAPMVIDLNDTVEGMLRMLCRLIGEDIDLSWMPGKTLWSVNMDPSQVDQILVNLCVNARDAIKGVGKITIETANAVVDVGYCESHLDSAPGSYVVLMVSDNGCGMDKPTQERIFEPFFTTKALGHGTGLGLATVYGIVKQNGGFINVYSEPGEGTTFKIFLPRHAQKAEMVRRYDSERKILAGNETILVVEDEPLILKVATVILKNLGYTVLSATTPVEALGLAEQHGDEIHLLVTDVIMPEMNGRELSEKIMNLYPDIRCLFMSGYTANVIAHHGVLDRGVNFIQKPFSKTSLAAKVRDVFDGVEP